MHLAWVRLIIASLIRCALRDTDLWQAKHSLPCWRMLLQQSGGVLPGVCFKVEVQLQQHLRCPGCTQVRPHTSGQAEAGLARSSTSSRPTWPATSQYYWLRGVACFAVPAAGRHSV
jgi:hypothetical protein